MTLCLSHISRYAPSTAEPYLMHICDPALTFLIRWGLSSIVDKAFIYDLKKLHLYYEPYDDEPIEGQSLTNLGLIDNNPGGYWKSDTLIQLNDTGRMLCDILKKANWLPSKN